MRRIQRTAMAVSMAKRLGVFAGQRSFDKIFQSFRTGVRNSRTASQTAFDKLFVVTLLVCGCVLPAGALAEGVRRIDPSSAVDSWGWAKADQTSLRVLALDAARQQVVIKVGDGSLTMLKSGEQIPSLAIRLTAVVGRTALFQPTNSLEREGIERIGVALQPAGGQTTFISRLTAPARPLVSGWAVIPR